MPVTKREEVTKQGFLGTWKNILSSGKSLISDLFNFNLIIAQVVGVGVGAN